MKTIELLVKQTKAGDDYHVFKMEDGKFLSVFKFDTRFSEINVGTELPDDVLIYDQQYNNYKLKPLPKPAGAPRGGFGGKQAEALMEKKNESIKGFQDDKEKSIALSSAQRDAVLMVTTFETAQPFPTDSELRAKIVEWREWFLKEHQNRSGQPF